MRFTALNIGLHSKSLIVKNLVLDQLKDHPKVDAVLIEVNKSNPITHLKHPETVFFPNDPNDLQKQLNSRKMLSRKIISMKCFPRMFSNSETRRENWETAFREFDFREFVERPAQ